MSLHSCGLRLLPGPACRFANAGYACCPAGELQRSLTDLCELETTLYREQRLMEGPVLWAAIIFGLIAAVSFSLYRRSLGDSSALSAMLVMTIIDDQFRNQQRKNLDEFLASSDVQDASNLSARLYVALIHLSKRLAGEVPGTILGAHAAVWQEYKRMGRLG
jgi:hypothetical protein